jgi:hypothetical protein
MDGSKRGEARLTQVVGAHLEGLIPPHDESDFLRLLVSEQADVAGTALLPLELVLGEPEQLSAPA